MAYQSAWACQLQTKNPESLIRIEDTYEPALAEFEELCDEGLVVDEPDEPSVEVNTAAQVDTEEEDFPATETGVRTVGMGRRVGVASSNSLAELDWPSDVNAAECERELETSDGDAEEIPEDVAQIVDNAVTIFGEAARDTLLGTPRRLSFVTIRQLGKYPLEFRAWAIFMMMTPEAKAASKRSLIHRRNAD
jgi:hypothetical protein